MNETASVQSFRTLTRLIAGALACTLGIAPGTVRSAELTLLQTIPLPDVRGRIDHLAVDSAGGRLFVAALGNNSVEVIDTRAGRRIARITDLGKPQGVAYVAQGDRLFVASGNPGRVDVFSGPALSPIARIGNLDDADNVRSDPANHRVYVGYGDGALVVIDTQTLKSVGDIALSGHPESFQLEASGPRVYANVPSARQIAVVDRIEGRVLESWPLPERANFPMALDEADRRLFVAARQPAVLLVFDSSNGKRIATVPICADADDLFADKADRRVYIVCGEGTVDVVQWSGTDRFDVRGRVRSAPGARTGLYVPEEKRLYVAVPARPGSQAEVRVYSTK